MSDFTIINSIGRREWKEFAVSIIKDGVSHGEKLTHKELMVLIKMGIEEAGFIRKKFPLEDIYFLGEGVGIILYMDKGMYNIFYNNGVVYKETIMVADDRGRVLNIWNEIREAWSLNKFNKTSEV